MHALLTALLGLTGAGPGTGVGARGRGGGGGTLVRLRRGSPAAVGSGASSSISSRSSTTASSCIVASGVPGCRFLPMRAQHTIGRVEARVAERRIREAFPEAFPAWGRIIEAGA